MVAILHVFVGAGLCLNNILFGLVLKGSMFWWIMGGVNFFVALFLWAENSNIFLITVTASPQIQLVKFMPATVALKRDAPNNI